MESHWRVTSSPDKEPPFQFFLSFPGHVSRESFFPPHSPESLPNKTPPPWAVGLKGHSFVTPPASQTGRWSDSWRSALVLWNGHVQRAHDPGSWSGPVAEWHDLYWLLEQRVANSSQGSFASTRTRAVRGPPSKRWAEGYDVLERKLWV